MLSLRLGGLRAEFACTQAETRRPVRGGDDADRALDVDVQAHLAMLEQRIAALKVELSYTAAGTATRLGTNPDMAGSIVVGDVLTVDLGDGPELFVFGAAGHFSTELDVISPASPLGLVLRGAAPGDTVAYTSATGRTLHATLLSVG